MQRIEELCNKNDLDMILQKEKYLTEYEEFY
jgi:hypothetical protein